MENVIELKSVNFSYGKNKVLKDITFKIARGEFVGIVGPNGSGKSTLLNIIVGHLIPDSGDVLVFGRKVSELKHRGIIGYVPQRSYLFNKSFPISVKEVVSMGLYAQKGLMRRLEREDWQKVYNALEKVEMLDFKDRLIGALSEGQRQRVFIARALVSEPKLLFLDEPNTGMDIKAEANLFDILNKLHKESGITILMVTHNIWTIADKVKRIICIENGYLYPYCSIVEESEPEKGFKIIKHIHNGCEKDVF